MRLSTLGRYALRAMVDLALHQGETPVLRKDIVERQEISSNYLAHLFVKLKQAGLVESVMGPGGGYVLARDPAAITAADVLRAVDEQLEPVFCVGDAPETPCARADTCVTHLLWGKLGKAIIDLLDTVTLAELCEQAQWLRAEHTAGAPLDCETLDDRLQQWEEYRSGSILYEGAGI